VHFVAATAHVCGNVGRTSRRFCVNYPAACASDAVIPAFHAIKLARFIGFVQCFRVMKSNIMKTAAAAALCTLGFSTAIASADEEPGANPWRVIETGVYSNIEDASQKVIQTRQAWNSWWSRHDTTIEIVDGKELLPEAPAVDFEKETVIIATMGARPSGGYSIKFTNIRYDGEDVVATLKTSSPDPDGMVITVITAPYAIIAIPKHEGQVTFEFDE